MCPNQFECFGKGTATFMILGDRCTPQLPVLRRRPRPAGPPDPEEPARVAEAVAAMGLQLLRHHLGDPRRPGRRRGRPFRRHHPGHPANTIPQTLIEVLIPDFQGDSEALATVLAARPDVLNHNLETVARLYPTVRPEADYRRSLELLRRSKAIAPGRVTKCGIMVGLGETAKRTHRPFSRSAPNRLRHPHHRPVSPTLAGSPGGGPAFSRPKNSLSSNNRPWPWDSALWPRPPLSAAPIRQNLCIGELQGQRVPDYCPVDRTLSIPCAHHSVNPLRPVDTNWRMNHYRPSYIRSLGFCCTHGPMLFRVRPTTGTSCSTERIKRSNSANSLLFSPAC